MDWSPDLHKRFVQAVEQLGEKAVPSRILEVMGAEGLTRHNIASHLQVCTTFSSNAPLSTLQDIVTLTTNNNLDFLVYRNIGHIGSI